MFTLKEIVWAKVKGFPWWPAQIMKLPTSQLNSYRVSFVGQNNHAYLQLKSLKKYQQNYSVLKSYKSKALQNSIEIADAQLQKRNLKNLVISLKKNKTQISNPIKYKRISKKYLKKSLANKKTKHQKIKKQKNLIKNEKNNKQIQEIQENIFPEIQERSGSGQQIKQNQKNNQNSMIQQSQINSIEISKFQIIRNVDRKKIQTLQQKLINHISKINSSNFIHSRECFNLILKIEEYILTPQQLTQSKITNMISYIYLKFNENQIQHLQKDQIQKIKIINDTLMKSVVDYLFNNDYYQHFLKSMRKNQKQKNYNQIQNKQRKNTRPYIKKLQKSK